MQDWRECLTPATGVHPVTAPPGRRSAACYSGTERAMKRGGPRLTRATRPQVDSSLRTNPPTLTTPCVIDAWTPQKQHIRASGLAAPQAACKTRIRLPLCLQRGICLSTIVPWHPLHSPSPPLQRPFVISLRQHHRRCSASTWLRIIAHYNQPPTFSGLRYTGA